MTPLFIYSRINLVSFRASRGPLFPKPVSWLGLFYHFLLQTGFRSTVSRHNSMSRKDVMAKISNTSQMSYGLSQPKHLITLPILAYTDFCCFIVGSFLWAILPKSIKNDLNTELFCGCCLVAGVLWK